MTYVFTVVAALICIGIWILGLACSNDIKRGDGEREESVEGGREKILGLACSNDKHTHSLY